MKKFELVMQLISVLMLVVVGITYLINPERVVYVLPFAAPFFTVGAVLFIAKL